MWVPIRFLTLISYSWYARDFALLLRGEYATFSTRDGDSPPLQ